MQKVTVAVGTVSALKLRAVGVAFEKLGLDADISSHGIASGVPDQPFGIPQMREGATNRCAGIRSMFPQAEFALGIESGIVKKGDTWYDTICVHALRASVGTNEAYSAFFPIPAWIVKEIQTRSSELGEVVKILAAGGEKDALKYFSHDTLKREEILAQAIVCALMPLIFTDRYQPRVIDEQ